MFSLVLIPGLACDGRVWEAQLTDLARHRPVVASPAVHAQASIEAMAERLLAEHPGELVLCGASMGGMIAMEAVRQAPARVRGLALLGTYAHAETDELRAVREAAIVEFEAGRAEALVRANIAFAFSPAHREDVALTERYLRIVLDAGAPTLIRQNRAVIARPDARLHLMLLDCPAIVVCGEDDAIAPPQYSRDIAELIAHAQLHLLPDCGHMLTLEAPARLDRLLLDWLDRLPTGPTGD